MGLEQKTGKATAVDIIIYSGAARMLGRSERGSGGTEAVANRRKFRMEITQQNKSHTRTHT